MKNGRMGEGKNGRTEYWKNGMIEGWKNGGLTVGRVPVDIFQD